MAHHEHGDHYEPKDALRDSLRGIAVVGGAGALLSAVKNSLAKQNVGAMGFITRTGGTIALFAGMGGTYMFAKSASANLREKDDSYNSVIGGALAGAVMGTRFRTMPAVLGYSAALGVIMGGFEYTGGSLQGMYKDITLDEVSRKEMIRSTRRKPIESIIEEVGETPRTQAPGYELRRAERLKEKYGIVVPQA